MDELKESLKESITDGYVKAFKSLFEEERLKKEDLELKLKNSEDFIKLLTQQLEQARVERDFYKSQVSPEIDNVN